MLFNNGLTGGEIFLSSWPISSHGQRQNAYKFFVFFVSKVASPSKGFEPHNNTVM